MQTHQRLKITIRGAVQGVGFRPFIYRLATELGLSGWVSNSPQGVFIEVEGPTERLQSFLLRIEPEKPPVAYIQSLESSFLDFVGYTQFEIRESDVSGAKTTIVLPDIATCAECQREIFDPANRRYLYPFTNCTNCGPRFTIIEKIPYDRPNTSMKIFAMCRLCEEEYHNPADRRFHAQPNACPQCGPHLELWDKAGKVLARQHEAILQTAETIRNGKIAAVKGIGGFHLMVDARSVDAVERLRRLKRREEKPFALMFPDLAAVKAECEVSPLEERMLGSPESPIVLLRRRRAAAVRARVVAEVAPGNPNLGVLLPTSPLHHILMREVGFPVVATSGNLSDEPICTDEKEALERLGAVADCFLVHNRPIVRHVDDSIGRVVLGRELILRRSRGYAPLPISIAPAIPSTLGVGAHLKNTVALSVDSNVFISQHIGDLETSQAFDAFQKALRSLEDLYEAHPTEAACDFHPDYLSTQFARKNFKRLTQVQHHYAHILSCMAENHIEGPALGVAWDGTGYGLDGTIWGGEFLRITGDGFERFAHLRPFRLPGGDVAVREPRRSALGLLYEIYGDAVFDMKHLALLQQFDSGELEILRSMLKQKLNAPVTSSAGRLFDALSSLTGLRPRARFEGQAAMELEFALEGMETEESYPFDLSDAEMTGTKTPISVNWEKTVLGVLNDGARGEKGGLLSAKFHNTLVEMIVAVARRAREERVVLSGGCFQNSYLTQRAVERLKHEGFRPYWHQRVPPNDGGIALGQIVALSRASSQEI